MEDHGRCLLSSEREALRMRLQVAGRGTMALSFLGEKKKKK